MTPEERARELLTEFDVRWLKGKFDQRPPSWFLRDRIAAAVQDAEARGYRAAREQAAEVAEEQQTTNYHDWAAGFAAGKNKAAAAIRAMKPKETTDE